MHKPEKIQQNETHIIFCEFEIIKPDLVLIKKKKEFLI